MRINEFKRALAAKRPLIGIWQGLASAYTAEICAGAGFDWLLFDGEHAPNTIPTLLAQLQAVAPYPVHPIARPPIGETWLIKQYLDIGFQTLLLPLVANSGHAADLVRATRYPPAGTRGVGAALARASGWNRDRDYLACADQEICVLVQVETAEALRDLDAIARTEGVDGVFIGPADLSASLGHRGNPGHPEVAEAIDGAIATIIAAGKAPGILTADAAGGRRYLDLGCLFVGVGNDVGLLARAADGLAAQFRDAPAGAPATPTTGPY
jgi:4-hydroxy-2-oxoheptanedioate aldolase